jgi:anti-anti-sigma factor
VSAKIVVERGDDDVAVVVLRGEHETYSAARLTRRLGALIDEGFGLVIDLSTAVFVDSTTLLALLRTQRAAVAAGLGFVLQLGDESGRDVQRIFDVTHLASIFRVAGTRSEAIEAARVPAAAGGETELA